MAVGSLHVLVLEEGGGGEQDVGVVGGVGEELLVDDGEEVGLRHSAQDLGLVGRDGGGVRVVDEERLHWRVVELGEGMAQLGHVDDARVALEWACEHQVGAFEDDFVPREGSAGRKLQAAAEVLPGADERGQHGDGACGLSTVLAALDAVVHADDGGRGGGHTRGRDALCRLRGCRSSGRRIWECIRQCAA